MCFIEREDLPARLAGVAKARDRVSLQDRLTTFVALQRVVTVQAIVSTDVVVYIKGSLIDIHGRGRCTAKLIRANVRKRNQGQKLLDDRIRHSRALGGGGN